MTIRFCIGETQKVIKFISIPMYDIHCDGTKRDFSLFIKIPNSLTKSRMNSMALNISSQELFRINLSFRYRIILKPAR